MTKSLKGYSETILSSSQRNLRVVQTLLISEKITCSRRGIISTRQLPAFSGMPLPQETKRIRMISKRKLKRRRKKKKGNLKRNLLRNRR
jgi:hypothetical protein